MITKTWLEHKLQNNDAYKQKQIYFIYFFKKDFFFLRKQILKNLKNKNDDDNVFEKCSLRLTFD